VSFLLVFIGVSALRRSSCVGVVGWRFCFRLELSSIMRLVHFGRRVVNSTGYDVVTFNEKLSTDAGWWARRWSGFYGPFVFFPSISVVRTHFVKHAYILPNFSSCLFSANVYHALLLLLFRVIAPVGVLQGHVLITLDFLFSITFTEQCTTHSTALVPWNNVTVFGGLNLLHVYIKCFCQSSLINGRYFASLLFRKL